MTAATGLMASAQIASANTNQTLLTPSAVGRVDSFTAMLTNNNAGDVKVWLALSASATPSAWEWIWNGLTLASGQTIKETGLLLAYGQYCVIKSDTATDVGGTAWGYEK
jgi:hypothetical protein